MGHVVPAGVAHLILSCLARTPLRETVVTFAIFTAYQVQELIRYLHMSPESFESPTVRRELLFQMGVFLLAPEFCAFFSVLQILPDLYVRNGM